MTPAKRGSGTGTRPQHVADEVTLREHIEAQIEGVRRELLLVQEAQRIAVEKAEEAQQLRNEAMNEWRSTVTDILATAATKDAIGRLEVSLRATVEALEHALEKRIDANKESIEGKIVVNTGRIENLEKRGSGQTGWIAGAAAVGALVISFLLWWFKGGRG